MIKIAIASGKGGTGKTFVATNIFYTLVKNQIDAVLVDCDAESPNAVAFFKAEKNSALDVNQLVPVINTDKLVLSAGNAMNTVIIMPFSFCLR